MVGSYTTAYQCIDNFSHISTPALSCIVSVDIVAASVTEHGRVSCTIHRTEQGGQ